MLVLRHAESANLLAGASGQVPDAPLTERGSAQARALAPAGLVYASTARRARETAAAFGTAVVAVPELVEFSVGGRDGAVDPALAAETAAVLRAWVVDGELHRRVGDGETGREVLDRTVAGLVAAADAGADAVVGHVGGLTLAVSVLCGLGGAVWGRPLPPAVPFEVRREPGGWRCPHWPV
jgi:broad specificity phosphatase PhoE